jgi:outer membrane lipoprotein
MKPSTSFALAVILAVFTTLGLPPAVAEEGDASHSPPADSTPQQSPELPNIPAETDAQPAQAPPQSAPASQGASIEGAAPATQPPPTPPTSPSFTEVAANPGAYQGQEILLGGKVIATRQYYDTTQIEVMQLPLGPNQQPNPNQEFTQGRFLAFQKSGLNPMTIPPGTFVTVLGEVAGAAVPDPSQNAAAYPVLEVKTLNVWPAVGISQAAQAPPTTQPGAPEPPVDAPYGYPPLVTPVPPLPPQPLGVSPYYYTPYWDPYLSDWFWRPFWVYPWWAAGVVVVPPPFVIVRHSPIPFGHPRRFAPGTPIIPRHGGFSPPTHNFAPGGPLRVDPPGRRFAPPSASANVAPQSPRSEPPVHRFAPPQFHRDAQAPMHRDPPPQMNRSAPPQGGSRFQPATGGGSGSGRSGGSGSHRGGGGRRG